MIFVLDALQLTQIIMAMKLTLLKNALNLYQKKLKFKWIKNFNNFKTSKSFRLTKLEIISVEYYIYVNKKIILLSLYI